MSKGKIGVTTENIFPVIKKFLYSDHEIFLREIVANAVDATQKLKALASSGDFKGEYGDLTIDISVDPVANTLTIKDHGIGMTEDEVKKDINQIAFSSAGEFLEKYKDQTNLIGHFGLGFYSTFMVSKKVEIDTLSWQPDFEAVKWECDGTPEYKMSKGTRTERGTTVTLYLDDDLKEFSDKNRISGLLGKYCRFMPVPIRFGKVQEWKDNKMVDTDKDNIINNVNPLWMRKPTELKDDDYLNFYHDLFPAAEDPLFWIHLNVDYPFHLTGILYFPKIKDRVDILRNKIQLYCNQMYVTDQVENIVPEFLTLLHGVIDSPDIPLNVSRSYLQGDQNVKKISTYITKKVADRLEDIANNQKDEYEKKWDNLKIFIEYGMLTDEKFCERAMKFALFKNSEGKYFKYDDYRKAIEAAQTNKDKKVVYLYCSDAVEQYQQVETAKDKGYDVLVFDTQLDAHFVNLLETKIADSSFIRVDSDVIDKLIAKDDIAKPEMDEEKKKTLNAVMQTILPKDAKFTVDVENLGEKSAPIVLTQSEFMRRYRDMSSLGGGMNFMGDMPASYNIVINAENPVMAAVLGDEAKIAPDNKQLCQCIDLALLANNMLKGKALADFIKRSEELMK
ncbi:MAG: molecular chaperone HtpG [Bacteroidales bacterium]|jgi:molecular chaperone HtpG|nr:molecular chaperone HtpG [Bacteroidales bacterium]MCI2121775.1 molecular chaperone HtpG [Bacteroidales bacterium]MCI2144761.1 molecular chaperone HtpG [Bacteroidales bacterium]